MQIETAWTTHITLNLMSSSILRGVQRLFPTTPGAIIFLNF